MLIKHETPHGSFVSGRTFVLASTGAIIGLANFWRFPYVMAEHGGIWFFLTYVAFLLIFALPLLYAEMLLGRMSRCSPIGGMHVIAADYGAPKGWAWTGRLATAAGMLTLALYTLVSGMTLAYIFKAAFGDFTGSLPNDVTQELTDLRNNRYEMLAWELIFLLGVLTILRRGVNRGIERAARYLMPLFFMIMLVLLTYSLRQGDLQVTKDFLYAEGVSAYGWRSVLFAAQHAFFTLGIGMGAMMVFGAYSPGRKSLLAGLSLVVGFDLLISVLAGFMIFPLIFAAGLGPAQGFDLIFRVLPMAFGQLPGGQFFAAMFFVLMTFAAWSSAIALGEPFVAWLIERFKASRLIACFLLIALVGAISQGLNLSLGLLSDWRWYGMSLFSMYEVVVSGLLIPGAALLIALYVGYVLPADRLKEVVTELDPRWFYILWRLVMRYFAPVLVVILMGASVANFVIAACEKDRSGAKGLCAWLPEQVGRLTSTAPVRQSRVQREKVQPMSVPQEASEPESAQLDLQAQEFLEQTAVKQQPVKNRGDQ